MFDYETLRFIWWLLIGILLIAAGQIVISKNTRYHQ